MKKKMRKINIIIFGLLTLILSACTQTKINATTLVVTPNEVSVNVGASLNIDVTVLPTDASNKALTWTILDENIATITNDGLLTGISVGATTMTVKVSANPTVAKTIPVSVVEEYWPNDRIHENFGFTLPKFPTYSSLTVNDLANDGLEIIIAGYGDDIAALASYNVALVAEYWVPNSTNDSHIGSYTKDEIEAVVSYHNNTSHGVATIEFTITKTNDHHEHYHWDDVQAAVYQKFDLILEDFEGVKEAIFTERENEIVGTVELGDRTVELRAYLDVLVAGGWQPKEGATGHAGTYVKGDFFFAYHEDHADDTLVDFKITISD